MKSRPGETMGAREADRQRARLRQAADRAALFDAIALHEEAPELATVWRRAAEQRRREEAAAADALTNAGEALPARRPSWRARALALLARRVGVGMALPLMRQRLRSGEERGDRLRALQALDELAPEGVEGSVIARIGARHKVGGANTLRAGVLGANDGLVSNLALVMGVAGAELGAREILITGVAGLLAGAFSMAMGEWVSVQSSRELYTHELDVEAGEIERSPEAEQAELALIYRAKGLSASEARTMASSIMRDPDRALDTMAREELGIDPHELGGSPWHAAIASFALFVLGALPPVVPFAVLDTPAAIAVSAALSALILFVIGVMITVFTGRNPWFSGIRQLAFGLAAAAVTFGIGRLIGVAVA